MAEVLDLFQCAGYETCLEFSFFFHVVFEEVKKLTWYFYHQSKKNKTKFTPLPEMSRVDVFFTTTKHLECRSLSDKKTNHKSNHKKTKHFWKYYVKL